MGALWRRHYLRDRWRHGAAEARPAEARAIRLMSACAVDALEPGVHPGGGNFG